MQDDNLYAKPRSEVDAFQFNQEVVDVFEDMIARSVPHYLENLEELVALAAKAYQPGTRVYDLGCSKGAVSLPLALKIKALNATIIAIDNAEAMIASVRAKIGKLPIEARCENVQDIAIERASVVILNYVLQFISPDERTDILENIYAGLTPNGVVLISEKITHDDPEMARIYIDRHHAFKKANGYSLLEISQKRQALEDVLVPESLDAHIERLKRIGFQVVDVWDKHYNFVSLYCRK
jgi:tRNA (cmo5U34)-methyltransferase